MKKQFLRVKQIADQTFLRAEKTDVLTEDLVNAERRVDNIKQTFQVAHKKIAACQIDFGSEGSTEKRMRKIPQVALATSLLENGYSFSKNSILGTTLKECASTHAKLGNELLEYYNEVEKNILKPMSGLLENDVHSIYKLKKQLGKLTLDMDSIRHRVLSAERHSIQVSLSSANLTTTPAKIDTLKDELEEASQKVDQCRDALASEMFALVAREPILSEIFIELHRLQANYHRNALAALEASLPVLEKELADFSQKPVYGCSIDDHLRVTNRQIAHVIEICIYFLLEYGICEEGLLRIAGSTSKLKRLKSAFDAGVDVDMTEYICDPHAVSGALKSYLRELPEPLLTFFLYDEWMAAARIQEFDQRLQALWHVVHKLPENNFNNLQYVIKFLSKLHENADVNKMSSQNIAIVMAPNLIWCPLEDANLGLNMSTANLHSTIIDTLITYADWFFPDAEIVINPKPVTNTKYSKHDDSLVPDFEAVEGKFSICSLEPATNSPRCASKSGKKPAAPPPPAKKTNYKSSPDTDLVDVTLPISNTEVKLLSEGTSAKQSLPPSPRTVVRRKSNENIASFLNSNPNKTDKPNVPEKPPYSSYSLDRVLQRSSFSSRHSCTENVRAPRPTVPPPDRPSKTLKQFTVENSYCTSIEKSIQGDIREETESTKETEQINMISESPSKQDLDTIADTSQSSSPVAQLNAKSNFKPNSFDFIIAQTAEKPPERPPRTTSSFVQDFCERTNLLSEANMKENIEKVPCDLSSFKVEAQQQQISADPADSPDSERPKPPRPLPPPIPYSKPKMNITENTSL